MFLQDEPETARLILRDLVNATLGFEQLAVLTDKPRKSLQRMLSPKGNPVWTTSPPSSARSRKLRSEVCYARRYLLQKHSGNAGYTQDTGMGNQEIEAGKVTPVAEVARRLKAKKTAAA